MQLAQIGSTGKIDSTDNSTLLKQQSKVLIVEDEALFARAVMRELQKSG
jgi:hypothetical protein